MKFFDTYKKYNEKLKAYKFENKYYIDNLYTFYRPLIPSDYQLLPFYNLLYAIFEFNSTVVQRNNHEQRDVSFEDEYQFLKTLAKTFGVEYLNNLSEKAWKQFRVGEYGIDILHTIYYDLKNDNSTNQFNIPMIYSLYEEFEELSNTDFIKRAVINEKLTNLTEEQDILIYNVGKGSFIEAPAKIDCVHTNSNSFHLSFWFNFIINNLNKNTNIQTKRNLDWSDKKYDCIIGGLTAGPGAECVLGTSIGDYVSHEGMNFIETSLTKLKHGGKLILSLDAELFDIDYDFRKKIIDNKWLSEVHFYKIKDDGSKYQHNISKDDEDYLMQHIIKGINSAPNTIIFLSNENNEKIEFYNHLESTLQSQKLQYKTINQNDYIINPYHDYENSIMRAFQNSNLKRIGELFLDKSQIASLNKNRVEIKSVSFSLKNNNLDISCKNIDIENIKGSNIINTKKINTEYFTLMLDTVYEQQKNQLYFNNHLTQGMHNPYKKIEHLKIPMLSLDAQIHI